MKLKALLADGRVRLVCFPHCSNVVAAINDVASLSAMARAAGARVVVECQWRGFGPQRQYAQSLVNHDWILWLDSDEVVSPELRASIEAVLSRITGPFRTVFIATGALEIGPHGPEKALRAVTPA